MSEVTDKIQNAKYGNDLTANEIKILLEQTNKNICDQCSRIENSDDLIWITTEDFNPKEKLTSDIYDHDAVCGDCYNDFIVDDQPLN